MAQENIGKEIPNTITVDVNAQSWDDGYNAAEKECAAYSQKSVDKYLGHTVYQWQSLAFSFSPLLVFILIVFLWARIRGKQYTQMNKDIIERQKKSLEVVEKSVEMQEKQVELAEKANILLQQLLEKLGNK